jgi:hypothetical protein
MKTMDLSSARRASMQRTFDVRAVREQFPALGRTHNGRKVVYLDGPAQSAASPERRRGMLKLRWGISLCYPIAIHWRRFS